MTAKIQHPIPMHRLSVLFPLLRTTIVGTGLLVAFLPIANADMPPHGRPAELRLLPGIGVTAASSADEQSFTGQFKLEGKINHKTIVALDLSSQSADDPDIAINGDVAISAKGNGFSAYRQLDTYNNIHWTIGLRFHETEGENDAAIVSGGSRIEYSRDRFATEVAILAEHQNWANGKGLQPYVGFAVRQTERVTETKTSGGRPISLFEEKENTAHVTGGVHWQKRRWSLFGEASASNQKNAAWRLHLGLRYGLFMRPDNLR